MNPISTWEKMNLDPTSLSPSRSKYETKNIIKLLEENIEPHLYDLGAGANVLNKDRNQKNKNKTKT